MQDLLNKIHLNIELIKEKNKEIKKIILDSTIEWNKYNNSEDKKEIAD